MHINQISKEMKQNTFRKNKMKDITFRNKSTKTKTKIEKEQNNEIKSKEINHERK